MPRALGNSSVVVRGKYANDFLGNPKCQENFHGMHSGLPFPSHAFGPTQEISLLKLAMGRWSCQESMVSADIMTELRRHCALANQRKLKEYNERGRFILYGVE